MRQRLLAPLLLLCVSVALAQENSVPAAPDTAPETAPAQTTATPAAPPPKPFTPEETGELMMAQKRYQAAIEAFKKADQNSARIWNKMGIAYQMLFSYENAMRCYQRSIRLDGKNAHVLNNLGTLYDARRDYGQAEKQYRKALKLTPKDPLILKNLGTNLMSQRKYKKAWEAYNTALAIDPLLFEHIANSPRTETPTPAQDRGAMNYYMAKSYTKAGRFDQAITALRLSVNQGYATTKKILADADFTPLRPLPEFQQMIAALKTP